MCDIQIEQAKQDLSRKDSELLAFRTKLETLTNQFSDSKQHVDVLKESLAAKEQRAAILQTEVPVFFYFCLYVSPLLLFMRKSLFLLTLCFNMGVCSGGRSSSAFRGKGVSPL